MRFLCFGLLGPGASITVASPAFAQPTSTISASGTTVLPLQSDAAVSGMSPDSTGLAFDWGWINAGAQVQYNLAVTLAGTYQLTLEAASPYNQTSVTVSVNGAAIGNVSFGNTGSYAQYQNAAPLSLPLSSGVDTLLVTANTAGFNLGGVSLTPAAVAGMCGAANGKTLASAPTSLLCSAGGSSSLTGAGPWSWSCLGSNGGTTASCAAAVAMPSLSPVSLNLPIVYPTNTLQINSTLSASTMASASIVQTMIQDPNGNIVSSSSQNLPGLPANTTLPVSFTYTIPSNNTVPPGIYKVSQGFVTSGNFTPSSNATFVVPAATATLNENFNDGRTTYNPNNIWVNYYNWYNLINNEAEAYVPDAVSIVPGTGLQIRADQRSFAGQAYTSGVITSLNGFSQAYGHFEMRAKLPGGAGTWPAFWLLPIDSTVFGSVSTVAGETDIMEHWGFQPTNIYQTLHTSGGVTLGCSEGSSGIASGTNGTLDWTQAYHVFALDWKPGVMTWLIDGVPCNTQTANIPNGPMYILANLAIGSAASWGGAPNAATPFPSYYDMNYIKVWQYPNMPTPMVPQERFLPGAQVSPAAPVAGQTITINGQIASGATDLGLTSVGAMVFDYRGSSVECYGSQLSYLNMPANTTAQFSIPCSLPANLPDGIYVIYIYSQPVSTASTTVPAYYYAQFMVGHPLPPLPH
jgi:beta-glucanase (GH16 family)